MQSTSQLANGRPVRIAAPAASRRETIQKPSANDMTTASATTVGHGTGTPWGSVPRRPRIGAGALTA